MDGANATEHEVTPTHRRETSVEASPPAIGTVLDGKYLLTRPIGQGGFGSVYEAKDLALGVSVAIKLVRSDSVCNTRMQDALREEAVRLTRLRHPNVVDWKSFATTLTGQSYFVMEHLRGQTLDQVLEKDQKVPVARTIRILLQILDALRAAHAPQQGAPILHLDLKPGNVLLEPHPSGSDDDWVKLIDFGLGPFEAKDVGFGGERDRTRSLGDETIRPARARPGDDYGVRRLTACTPNYAAPEHGAHLLHDVTPVQLDHRCDIYSLGVIAFRMLTGRLPFDGGDEIESILRGKLSVAAPKVASVQRRLPRRLAAFVDRCLERDRERRWQSADEAWRALRAIVDATRRRRVVAALVGVPAVSVITTTWWLLQRGAGVTVLAPVAGVMRAIEGQHLYFGPAQGAASLRYSVDTGERIESVRCVTAATALAPEVAWLSVSLGEAGTITLVASPTSEFLTAPVHLECTTEGARVRYVGPFDASFVPAGTCRIDDVHVPGSRERAIEPKGQLAVVRVEGPAEAVDAVWAVTRLGTRVEAKRAADAESEFVLPMAPLDLSPGIRSVDVILRDRAGNQAQKAITFDIAAERLQIASARLGAAALGGRAVLGPQSSNTLKVELNGPADVRWSILRETGVATEAGFLENVRSFARGVPFGVIDRDFEGTIELTAVDSRYAHRKDAERSQAVARIPFLYCCEPANLAVTVGLAGALQTATVDDVYVAHGPVVVRVARVNAVPVGIALEREGPDASRLANGRLDTRLGDSWQQELQLPAGRTQLRLLVWRLIDGQEAGEPVDSIPVRVVVDETPPSLRTSDERVVVRADSATRLLVIGDDDTSPHLRNVRWRVHDGAGVVTNASSKLGGDVPVGSEFSIDLAACADLGDGNYVLIVDAADMAGNSARPLEVPLVIAREGPRVEVVLPNGGKWPIAANGVVRLEVRATDPNHVARVECEVLAAGRAPRRVRLGQGGGLASDSLWTSDVSADDSWANEDLTCVFEAYDDIGNYQRATVVQRIGTIEREMPGNIAVAICGKELAGMRLVRGNSAGEYVFGGRGDEVEARLFDECALPAFNTLSVERSWRARVPAREIADFYVDESEVTVRQFLAFVDDPLGFVAPAWWRSDKQPPAARRDELRAQLTTLSYDAPVRGVTWDEAFAFARWSGRRLWTYVEWEYAVRGGLAYRASTLAPVPPAGGATAFGMEPAARGDVAPDTGLMGLCSGVSEWTQTPAAAGFGGRIARDGRPFNHVSPSYDAQESFWIVGPSPRVTAPSFVDGEVRRSGWSARHVGFRCVMPAADAMHGLRNDAGDRLTIEVRR